MTARHDTHWAAQATEWMQAPEQPAMDQRHVDLAALKVTSEFRQSLPLGSPEWRQALLDEDGLITRVVAWAGQRTAHLPAE
jgi:hypothetical protein